MAPAESCVPRTVRCAVYTRKSTEEGLSQEFNSLDAQRECAEAYILSQRQEGWTVLPEHYDDGGYSGANLDRPALQRLLAHIQAGQIDCVVIYKVDRLSRSLFDFARLMQVFEKHGVSFVSVTQQLNSNTPMGRLTLNVLLSFAQFEREIISERTRDKQSAARRKGKWTGGYPVLGYDPEPSRGCLVVNAREAAQVREIFGLFLRYESLDGTLAEMHRRGWQMKSWTTRKGQAHAGRRFDRAALVRLLSNVLYLGEVRHKGKVYGGEQRAILDRETWQQAQGLLRQRQCQERVPKRAGALLQDLLGAGCAAAGWCRATRPSGIGDMRITCAGERSNRARRPAPDNRSRQRVSRGPSSQECRGWPKPRSGSRCGRRCRVGVRWNGPNRGVGWRAWWNGLTTTDAAGGRPACGGERPSGTVSHFLFRCGPMRRRRRLRRRCRRCRDQGAGCRGLRGY
jgi:DNA invertase Pin-like site-specific DNA recombinase